PRGVEGPWDFQERVKAPGCRREEALSGRAEGFADGNYDDHGGLFQFANALDVLVGATENQRHRGPVPRARSEERRVGKGERWSGDWSSDVCSSDLPGESRGHGISKSV